MTAEEQLVNWVLFAISVYIYYIVHTYLPVIKHTKWFEYTAIFLTPIAFYFYFYN